MKPRTQYPASVSPWFKFFLGVTILLLPFILSAQQSMFTKVYYDNSGSAQAYATIQAPDHNFYIAGEKDGNAMALKAGPDGTIAWAKKTGSGISFFYDLALTADSCVVFAGQTFDPETLLMDVILLKIDPDGDTLWMRTIDFGGDDSPGSIRLTQDGGLILCGNSGSGSFLMRMDAAGDAVWSKFFSKESTVLSVFSVRQAPDGGFVVIGSWDGPPSWNQVTFLARLEGDGSLSWARSINALAYSAGLDLAFKPDGMMCLINGEAGLSLLKTDFSGNPQWCRNYWINFSTPWAGSPTPDLHQTSDGGFLFVDGSEYGPGAAVKVSADGDPVLKATVFMNTTDILETDGGGYLFTGNGPIIGVEMTGTDNPQIGVIKGDSLFNSTGCIYPEWPGYDILAVTADTFELEAMTASLVYLLPYEISDAVLSTDYGCVAFLGAVQDTPSEGSVLQIYPNPSDGIFNIGLTPLGSEKIKMLEIINSSGATIALIPDPGCRIDLSSYPNGLYLIRAETSGGTMTNRLVLNH